MTPDDIIEQTLKRVNNCVEIKYIDKYYDITCYDCRFYTTFPFKRRLWPHKNITVDDLTKGVNEVWVEYQRWLGTILHSRIMHYIRLLPVNRNLPPVSLPDKAI